MLFRHGLGIADPLANHVDGKRLTQFRLPSASEILPQLRPSLQTRGRHDPFQLPAQDWRRGPMPNHDELFRLRIRQRLALFGFIPRGVQIWPKLREDRDHSERLPFVVFGFRAANREPVTLPVDVLPSQGHHFRRNTQPAKPSQREQQTPFGIRAGLENGSGIGPTDEVISGRVPFHRADQIGKRVLLNQFPTDGRIEKLFRQSAVTDDVGSLSPEMAFAGCVSRVGDTGNFGSPLSAFL